jgi:glucan phosphoethanolaminetransferase (alkaline phosphatase superfamily)
MRILTQKRTVLKNNIRNFNLYSIAFLFISLAIWFLMPIVGIFPLLIFVQLNLLKSDNLSKNIVFLNNLVLILVVLTVCILLTSYTIYSDLVNYVQTYEQLGHLNPLDATLSYGIGTEFIPFFLAYVVYNLTNGSVYHYLLMHLLLIH